MMPLDQRHFPSLGFGKRNYGHRPHGGASGHMRGSAVFQELQVIREFKSGDLYSLNQHIYSLEGFIQKEIQKDIHIQMLITVGSGWKDFT